MRWIEQRCQSKLGRLVGNKADLIACRVSLLTPQSSTDLELCCISSKDSSMPMPHLVLFRADLRLL